MRAASGNSIVASSVVGSRLSVVCRRSSVGRAASACSELIELFTELRNFRGNERKRDKKQNSLRQMCVRVQECESMRELLIGCIRAQSIIYALSRFCLSMRKLFIYKYASVFVCMCVCAMLSLWTDRALLCCCYESFFLLVIPSFALCFGVDY